MFKPALLKHLILGLSLLLFTFSCACNTETPSFPEQVAGLQLGVVESGSAAAKAVKAVFITDPEAKSYYLAGYGKASSSWFWAMPTAFPHKSTSLTSWRSWPGTV